MNVGLALRNSPKGQIKYDRFWASDGRTKEVLDGVSLYSTNVKVHISPNVLSTILKNNEHTTEKKEVQEVVAPSLPPLVKESDDSADAYFYEQQFEMELPIMEYEEERLKYIHDTFNFKKCEFDNFSWELQLQIKQEYLLMRRKNELDAKRRVAELQKIEESILNEAKEKEMLQKEQYKNHVKKLSAKVLDAELKQKKAEEALKKRLQEQKELRVQLSNCQQEAQNLVSKSIEKLSSCDYPDYLRLPVTDRTSQMSKIIQLIESFVEQAKTKDLTIDDILSANRHVKEAYETFHDIINDIEQVKAKGLHAHERLVHFTFKDNSLMQKNVSNSETNKSETPIKEDTSINKSGEKKESESKLGAVTTGNEEMDKSKDKRKKLLSLFIAPDAIDDHHKIMENLKLVETNLQPIKTDPKNKKCRFELQKAINVPINSLSSNSGSQIKSKINRLLCILCGKVPEFSKYDMRSDSAVYSFCSYLVAKQFVIQGDTQISAQYSTAFPIALAVLGVWSQKPDIGPLILGHFYVRCPYLVPYYPPRREGQTDSDYFEILGYQFDDAGTIEPQYKFLNRMSGYMRLYAAIMVSPLPPNVKTPHPHGLNHCWKWISRILNLEPRVDITATLLYDFLEVTGDALQKAYGRQFKKLLHILCKDYFHKIKQITPGGSGPVERLETFLQQTVKKGYISAPEGILESHFWNR